MADALLTAFALLGLIVLIALVVLIVAVGSRVRARRLPARMILEVDFSRGVVEQAPQLPWQRFMRPPVPQMREVVEALQRAAADRRVLGLIAHIGHGPLRYGDIQELRNAIAAFRRGGKPAYAFAESFGETRPGTGAYYLASAFEAIHLQPSGEVGLVGLVSETPFVKAALDKLGIVPRLDARAEYKNLRNVFTENGYTPAHKEANQAVMDSLFRQLVHDIGAERGIDESSLVAMIDRAPISASDALDQKLVDVLGYWDDVGERLRERVGGETQRVTLPAYQARSTSPRRRRDALAYVCVTGNIVSGESRRAAMSGEAATGSRSIVRALKAAVDDKRVKAIVLRISSPGGSYVGSDAIHAAVARARATGKPVVVSMGALAASGGYFAAMGADRILAQPGTLTGSIGVVSGKLVVGELMDRLGIRFEEIHTSANATMALPTRDYTDSQWRDLGAWLDRVYADFVGKVAADRGLTAERAQELARGRVWTGADAHRTGLIDALGGIPEALAAARELAGIPAKAPLQVIELPKRPPWWKRMLSGPEIAPVDLATRARAALAELSPERGVLTAPEDICRMIEL